MSLVTIIIVLLSLAWLAPLASAIVLAYAMLWTHRLSLAPGRLAVATLGLATCCSGLAALLWDWSREVGASERAIHGSYYRLLTFGQIQVDVNYLIDGLTIVLFLIVCLISTCVAAFARAYLADELTEEYIDHDVHTAAGGVVARPGRQHQFFALLMLFCFAMLGIVLAGNLLQVFLFWELVGLASYLLIGFYRERPVANAAAMKAFLMNRVGDVGFLIGLFCIWQLCGTWQFDGPAEGQPPGVLEAGDRLVRQHIADGLTGDQRWLLLVAGLGIVAGCLGKSAQLPLQTWLPDAMAGPTPVSALVHSATMVAAGVYLAARCAPLFVPEVLILIAYIGAATMLLGAVQALFSQDLKRILAFSTMSQLGYMLLAIGLGSPVAGCFHLVTHACFKSLLFVAAGSVLLATHHTLALSKLGGLHRVLPLTSVVTMVAIVSMTGLSIPFALFGEVPFALAGHYSKEQILSTALAFVSVNPRHFILFFVPLITSGLTALYLMRLWCRVFGTKPGQSPSMKGRASAGLHHRDHSWWLKGSLVVLAILSAFVAIGGDESWVAKTLAQSQQVVLLAGAATPVGRFPSLNDIHRVHNLAGTLGLLASSLGLVLGWLVYRAAWFPARELRQGMSAVGHFIEAGFYFDELYRVTIIGPVRQLAQRLSQVDQGILDPCLHAISAGTTRLAMLERRFDEGVVDGLVNGLASRAWRLGLMFHKLQTGQLRQYLLFLVIGIVVVFTAVFVGSP